MTTFENIITVVIFKTKTIDLFHLENKSLFVSEMLDVCCAVCGLSFFSVMRYACLLGRFDLFSLMDFSFGVYFVWLRMPL